MQLLIYDLSTNTFLHKYVTKYGKRVRDRSTGENANSGFVLFFQFLHTNGAIKRD